MRKWCIRVAMLILLVVVAYGLGIAVAGRRKPARRSLGTARHHTVNQAARDALEAARLKVRTEAGRYRGHTFVVKPNLSQVEAESHGRIAREFERIDPKVPSRADYYHWLWSEWSEDTVVTAWSGHIVSVTPDGATGNLLVTTNLSPEIHAPNRGGVVFIKGRLEHWRYIPTARELVYLDGDQDDGHAPGEPHGLMVD